jgi:pyridoxamine 5'-phosphate oxidase
MFTMIPLSEPLERFHVLLAKAKALDRALLPEPTAFSLATVDGTGRPSVRIVLLKSADADGLVFYTNHHSRKGRELLGNPNAAMCFHWQALETQVRIEGEAKPVSDAEADAYFASRARGSQLGAWASEQSEPIAEAGDLEARVREVEERYAGKPVPRPAHWSGFRLLPTRWEFWFNRPSRLHLRERYEAAPTGWVTATLYP